MHEVMFQLLHQPGLAVVLIAATIAGIVYGFAGFGAALIFMPIATVFIPVEMAVAAFSISALASFVAVVPQAWRQADRRNVLWMIAAAGVTLPVGLWLLRSSDTTTIRWAVIGVTAVTLIVLMSGWRYQMRPGLSTNSAVAASAGLIGGATGLVGPVMVLFQLGGQSGVEQARANTLVFLSCTGLIIIPLMALQGMLTLGAVLLGLVIMVPYGIAAKVGQRLFDPERQVLYRRVAYGLIAAAIFLGLPIYD